MTFTHAHATYTVTNSSTPAERGLDYLAAEYDRTGWTHTIAARRPKGTKDYFFHARIEGGAVVMTSGPF